MAIDPDIPRGELRYLLGKIGEKARANLEAEIEANPDTANAEIALTRAIRNHWEELAIYQLQDDLKHL